MGAGNKDYYGGGGGVSGRHTSIRWLLYVLALMVLVLVYSVAHNVGGTSSTRRQHASLTATRNNMEISRRNFETCKKHLLELKQSIKQERVKEIEEEAAEGARTMIENIEEQIIIVEEELGECEDQLDAARKLTTGTEEEDVSAYLERLDVQIEGLHKYIMLANASREVKVTEIKRLLAAMELEMRSMKAPLPQDTEGAIDAVMNHTETTTIKVTATTKTPTSTSTGACEASRTRYSVVFDAGSTGSRVHVYSFAKMDNGSLVLENEVFVENKIPLSSFPTTPVAAAESLQELLATAHKGVPEADRKCTPIELKATAGLRSIGEAESNAILDAVRASFRKSGFLMADEQSAVSLLAGTTEGRYAWITVNYLLGAIGTSTPTAAVVDLGGGSTQIVFQPTNLSGAWREERAAGNEEHFYNLSLGGKGEQLVLYQHSYEGMGLQSAKRTLVERLGAALNETGKLDDFSCLPRAAVSKHNDRVSNAHGAASYRNCTELFRKHVVHNLNEKGELKDTCAVHSCGFSGVYQPHIGNSFSGPIYLMSYYYDRLKAHAGENATVTVSTVRDIGEKVCSALNTAAATTDGVSKQDEELCLDVSYLSVLLTNGYGIPEDREMFLVKKIRGYETAWSLGAAIQTLGA